jgi:hypothetical protein
MADAQAGVFYPINLLLGVLFSPHHAVTLGLLLHQWWAALGMYLLCRHQGASVAASRLAGVGFGLSGFMVSHFTYVGLQQVMAWIPFAAWATLRVGEGEARGRLRALALGVGVAALGTAGHPQAAAIAGVGCGVLFLSVARTWRAWGQGLLGGGLGALACLPQWLATWELVRESSRGGGVGQEFAGIGSLPPQELLNLGLPRFWGFERPADMVATYVHKGAGYFGTGESHWEMCIYLGIVVIGLAGVGLGQRGARIWKGLAVASLLLMLGRYTPVWGLFRMLPGFDHFRFPVRFALWLVLAANVLAARGLDRLLEHLWKPGIERLLGWMTLGLVGGGLAVSVVHRLLVSWRPGLVERAVEALGRRPDAAERAEAWVDGLIASTSLASTGLLWPLLLATTGLVLVHAARRERIGRPELGTLLLLLLVVDLTVFGSNYNPRSPTDVVDASPATQAVVTGEEGLYRTTVVSRVQPPELDKELMSASLGLLAGTRDVIVPSPLRLPRNDAILVAAGLDIGADPTDDKIHRLETRLSLSEMMGVRYLLSAAPLEHPHLEQVHGGAVRVYRNQHAMERAFVVGCVVEASGADEALQALIGVDPARVAVVEGPTGLGCGDPAGSASVVSHGPTEVRVTTHLDAPGLLVLTDSWYPGWEALVDGTPAPVLRSNVAFRGVVLPKGDHEVVFRYRPWWARLLPLGICAWLVLALGLSMRGRWPGRS